MIWWRQRFDYGNSLFSVEFQTDSVRVMYGLYFVINTECDRFNTFFNFRFLILVFDRRFDVSVMLALYAVLYRRKESAVQVLYLSVDF